MALDTPTLHGLNREERDAALGALAGLFLQAANIAVKEDDDGPARSFMLAHSLRKPRPSGCRPGLTPRSSPGTERIRIRASWCPHPGFLASALERRSGLEMFLDDRGVAIKTNHLERALRPIPPGKRNWLFILSEVGAQRVGIIQSLLVTCRLHAVYSYTYLVDVLQRISLHPASQAIDLTPRMWKSLFADAPLQSDLGPHQHDLLLH